VPQCGTPCSPVGVTGSTKPCNTVASAASPMEPRGACSHLYRYARMSPTRLFLRSAVGTVKHLRDLYDGSTFSESFVKILKLVRKPKPFYFFNVPIPIDLYAVSLPNKESFLKKINSILHCTEQFVKFFGVQSNMPLYYYGENVPPRKLFHTFLGIKINHSYDFSRIKYFDKLYSILNGNPYFIDIDFEPLDPEPFQINRENFFLDQRFQTWIKIKKYPLYDLSSIALVELFQGSTIDLRSNLPASIPASPRESANLHSL
jgi:hypothetical protein